MPRLLRIEPNPAQLSTGVVKVGASAWEGAGKGLNDLGDTLIKLQDGADKANATRLAADYKANGEGTLKLNNQQISDPEQLKITNDEALTQHRETAIAGARSKQARTYLENLISDDTKRFAFQSQFDHFAKIKTRAEDEFVASKDQLFKSALNEPDEANRSGVYRMFGQLVGNMNANGYMNDPKKELTEFHNKVRNTSMALEAGQQPDKFTENYLAGKYKDADPVEVQRSLDIAGKTYDQRARRDAAQGKIASDAAERQFEEQAAERKLDVNELRKAQRLYGWEDQKVNGLIKMQIGTVYANPYEEQILKDAMKDVDMSVEYNIGQIRSSNAKIDNAIKAGKLSADTDGVRSAKRHLQGMADRLRVTGDIKAKDAEFGGRRTVASLFQKYFPGVRSPGVNSAFGDHLLKIGKLKPNEIEPYLDKLEQQLQIEFDKNKNPTVHESELRSRLKDRK